MIKKTVTFEDFEGVTVTEDLYFNISEEEVINMHTSGLANMLQELVKPDAPVQGKLDMMKKIIGMAYGERIDGRHFVKSDERRELFFSSLAYDAFFHGLLEGGIPGVVEFILGMVPKSMASEAASLVQTGKIELPVDIPPNSLTLTGVIVPPVKVDEPGVPAAFKAKHPKPMSEMDDAELEQELLRRKALKNTN
jgi:hypothetical protein